MTKASLTERQAIVSMPLARVALGFWTKPGKCLAEQVGVKAPGNAKSTTLFPLKTSSVVTSFGPFSVMMCSFAEGILSPTLMVIFVSLVAYDAGNGDRPAALGSSKHPAPGFGREARYPPALAKACNTASLVRISGSVTPSGAPGP